MISDDKESELVSEDDSDIEVVVEIVEDNEEEGEEGEEEEEESDNPHPSHDIQIVIHQDPNLDRDDYEDCTWGHDILKAVLRERKSRGEVLFYEVEFEDGHTEKVSLCFLLFFPSLLPALHSRPVFTLFIILPFSFCTDHLLDRDLCYLLPALLCLSPRADD